MSEQSIRDKFTKNAEEFDALVVELLEQRDADLSELRRKIEGLDYIFTTCLSGTETCVRLDDVLSLIDSMYDSKTK